MSYHDLIFQNIDKVYQAGIATKIMQHMARIRNSSDVNQARRWVMELLQNARDVAYPDQPVKIRITLKEDKLTFSHTGMPFRVENILAIINQVSSKVDDEETVGQFGTGFVTTFQLSEQVQLDGVLKDEGLPYKPFSVLIDRRGYKEEEILQGIGQAMKQIEEADAALSLENYDREEFHTTFRYFLEQQRSREIARIGMEDLQDTIFYVLLFSRKIESVELVYRMPDLQKSVIYTRGEERQLGERLCITEFQQIIDCGESRQCERYQICSIEKDGMTLAAGYSEESGFLEFSEKCARIFLDFPLIGSEKFCFPVVVNSQAFHPNEPRSGISLVDQVTSVDAGVNKEEIEKAVSLYQEFLTEVLAHQLPGIVHIIAIPQFEANREWSEYWVKCHIYRKLYSCISKLPLLETACGKQSLGHPLVYLLQGDTTEEIEGLKKLLEPIRNIYYALGTEDWYGAFSGYGPQEDKIFSLEKLLGKAEIFIQRKFRSGSEDPGSKAGWCRKIYLLAMQNERLRTMVNVGEAIIFPAQKLQGGSVWNMRTIQEIYLDPGIPEELKDVTEVLDTLPPREEGTDMERCSLRSVLLHKDFRTEGVTGIPEYEWSRLANYLATKTNENFAVCDFFIKRSEYIDRWKKAWLQMAACGPDREMYDLIRAFYRQETVADYACEEKAVEKLGEGTWFQSYHGLLQNCIREITRYTEVQDFGQQVLGSETDVYEWLNRFYKKWFRYQYRNEDNGLAIYPDQEGKFVPLYSLKKDGIKEKTLKEIAYALRGLSEQCNFYRKLLHKEICGETVTAVVCSDREVAMEINNVVTQLLARQNLSDAEMEYQEACSMLLTWIQEHPAEAGEYFPAFSKEEDQMKLLTPRAAVRIQQKANRLEKIMNLLDCGREEDPEELIQKLLERQEMLERTLKETNFETGQSKDFVEEESGVTLEEAFLKEMGWLDLEEDTLRQKCREIGILGEKYVLTCVKNYYRKQGLTVSEDTDSRILLQGGNGSEARTVRLEYPDNATYHQAGWDIRVTDSTINVTTQEYIEIKTHTRKSYVRKQIRLSNEQMKKAIREGAHYHVLVAVYDYSRKEGQEIIPYTGFLENVADGKLKNDGDGYYFHT